MNERTDNEGQQHLAIYPVLDQRGRKRLLVMIHGDILEVRAAEPDAKYPTQHIALGAIQSMRLNYAPASEYADYHHICQLRDARGTAFVFRANAGMEEEQAGYRELVAALHAHFMSQPKVPTFLTGMGSGMLFWSLTLFFMACFALAEVGVVVGTLRKQNYLVGALFLLLIPVIGYYLLRFMISVGRPSTYDPGAVPLGLLP